MHDRGNWSARERERGWKSFSYGGMRAGFKTAEGAAYIRAKEADRAERLEALNAFLSVRGESLEPFQRIDSRKLDKLLEEFEEEYKKIVITRRIKKNRDAAIKRRAELAVSRKIEANRQAAIERRERLRRLRNQDQ